MDGGRCDGDCYGDENCVAAHSTSAADDAAAACVDALDFDHWRVDQLAECCSLDFSRVAEDVLGHRLIAAN